MWLVSQNTKVPLQSFKTKHEAHAWGRERLHGWFIVWQGKGVRDQGGRTTDQEKRGQGAGLKDHGPGPKGLGNVTKV
jgi:hypothetical protein